MAKDPAVLLYTSDFLSGMSFFTMEQRGQYITLLCQQHQTGHIPEDHMVSICGSISSPVVSKFQKDSNGFWFNIRMDEEKEKRNNFTGSRHKNGLLGGRPSNKPKNNLSVNLVHNHMGNHMENENDNGNGVCVGINSEGVQGKPQPAKISPLHDPRYLQLRAEWTFNASWNDPECANAVLRAIAEGEEFQAILQGVINYRAVAVAGSLYAKKKMVNWIRERAWTENWLEMSKISQNKRELKDYDGKRTRNNQTNESDFSDYDKIR